MQQPHTTSHVIRVDRQTYPQLHAAVAQHQLQPSDEVLAVMAQGQVYRPTGGLLSQQMLFHDRLLQLGHLHIKAELYRLPEQEYSTLLTASQGTYTQYSGMQGLMASLLAPMAPAAEAVWINQVRAAVARGRQPTTAVDLVDNIWTPTTWLRGRTRLIQRSGHWFVVLYFAQAPRLRVPPGQTMVGVDVGLRPLATAVMGQHHAATREVHGPAALTGEAAEVQTCVEILTYAAARAALEGITVPVLATAATLVLEHLDYANFASNFPSVARRRAVADWHMSWAPQRAYAHGIEVVRVSAAWTSQTCSRCRGSVRGTRQGRSFTCPNGHRLDAHANAAANLVRRAQGQRAKQAPRVP